jgi:hypothetical protein
MKPHGRQSARGGRILMRESPAAAEPKTKPANRQRKNSPVHARRKRGKQPKPQIWKQKLATRKTTQENHQKSLN